MIKFKVLLFTLCFSLQLNAQFKAIHIPDELIGSIKIDGDTADWHWVPSQYVISSKMMKDDLTNSKINTLDWDCRIIVAWNHLTNLLYINAVVYDDYRSVDRKKASEDAWLDDGMEVAINANNLGGEYHHPLLSTYKYTTKFCYSFPTLDNTNELLLYNGPSWLLNDNNLMKWCGKISYISDNKSITVYEAAFYLWDYWGENDMQNSLRCDLVANKLIRLAIAFNDVDLVKDKREAQWILSSTNSDWWKDAGKFSQFILYRPKKTGISWDMMNSLVEGM